MVRFGLVVAILTMISSRAAAVQDTGTVQGAVTLGEEGESIHGAVILILGPGLVVLTDETGAFLIDEVPVGTYEIFAQREHLSAERKFVTVEAGQTSTVNFILRLSPIHEEVTVTATVGGQSTTFEAFNATTTLDSFDMVTNPVGTLAEALEDQPGIAIRSSGPGSGRPIIRGFGGDRVLIMEDGIGTGDLSSQSGDHGVNTDPNGLDRIEIVRGPATLLYGSNAVGGVVNAITPHESFKDSVGVGTRGQVSVDGGSANDQVGTFANLQHSKDRLMMWAGGGTRRAGDYMTPDGVVRNSATKLATGRAGIGYVGGRLFASSGVTVEDGRYGIPDHGGVHSHGDEHEGDEHEGFVDLDSVRRVGRFDIGMRHIDARAIDSFRVVANITDWQHKELEIDEASESIGTVFNNQSYVIRADVEQSHAGSLSGRFGILTKIRDYEAIGSEAITPATTQLSMAAFVYEEVDFGWYQLQFGGRLERNSYEVSSRLNNHDDTTEEHSDDERGGGFVAPAIRDRKFVGGSASVGFRAELGFGNAFVTNLTRSHRAPALEELYSFGAHIGNRVFEVGNPDLEAEMTVGLDAGFRHQSSRLRGDVNVYLYDIGNFVFFDVQDEFVSGLHVANVFQGDGRFTGFDAKGSFRLGSRVWANIGIGLVNARLTTTNEALPRIPPLRGQFSIDVPYRGFTVTPEWNFAARQGRVFRDETATEGFSVFNVRASYVWPARHLAHILSVSAYNLTDELYRSHTSFIKDLAPEIGRGIKIGYSLRFF
jgi:iron complex outermembrane receptor protein